MSDARTDDPAAFWASLTPERRLALAKAAPKVLRKWKDKSNGFCARLIVGTIDDLALAFVGPDDGTFGSPGKFIYHILGHGTGGSYDNPSAAKSACDAELIRLGYVLEPGE